MRAEPGMRSGLLGRADKIGPASAAAATTEVRGITKLIEHHTRNGGYAKL